MKRAILATPTKYGVVGIAAVAPQGLQRSLLPTVIRPTSGTLALANYWLSTTNLPRYLAGYFLLRVNRDLGYVA